MVPSDCFPSALDRPAGSKVGGSELKEDIIDGSMVKVMLCTLGTTEAMHGQPVNFLFTLVLA